LGRWINRIRTNYKKELLSAERIAVLQSIVGWTWDPRSDDFEIGLARLRAFIAQEGNAKVPARYVDSTGFQLGKWVDHRRQFFRRGKLSPDKIAALEAMPAWVWTVATKE
jgi:hypothetical protein